MILRGKGRGTRSDVTKDVLLCRNSNRGPPPYQSNSISNDGNNSNNNTYSNTYLQVKSDVNDLGNGSAHNIFRCNSKRCLFQNKFSPQDRIVRTITNHSSQLFIELHVII